MKKILDIDTSKLKNKQFKAEWSFLNSHLGVTRFDEFSDEELDELYRDTFDRWSWETASDEDFQAYKAMERELKRRNSGFRQLELELMENMAKEISKEIDNEILKTLRSEFKVKDDERC